MTSLSEAYVNYCIAAEGLELDNGLAEVFSQERSMMSYEPYDMAYITTKVVDDILL